MNLIDSRHAALVLVDYQARLMPLIHNGAQALAQAVRLADIAHALAIPVFGTEQNPQGLGANADAVRERCGCLRSCQRLLIPKGDQAFRSGALDEAGHGVPD